MLSGRLFASESKRFHIQVTDYTLLYNMLAASSTWQVLILVGRMKS